jgi:hypothetical protein
VNKVRRAVPIVVCRLVWFTGDCTVVIPSDPFTAFRFRSNNLGRHPSPSGPYCIAEQLHSESRPRGHDRAAQGAVAHSSSKADGFVSKHLKGELRFAIWCACVVVTVQLPTLDSISISISRLGACRRSNRRTSSVATANMPRPAQEWLQGPSEATQRPTCRRSALTPTKNG